MGSVTILLLPIMPLIYLIMWLGSLFGTPLGLNVTEVALPYNEETGLVWECEETDYGWFELTDTKIDGDTQIFVFEAEPAEEDCTKVVFTAQNGEELVYYGRDNGPILPMYGKVVFYSPDEYVIYDYTLEPQVELEGGYWSFSTSGPAAEFLVDKTEADGKVTFSVLCFEGSAFDHCYSYKVRDSEGVRIPIEDVVVYYKNTEGKGVETWETRHFYEQNLPQ